MGIEVRKGAFNKMNQSFGIRIIVGVLSLSMALPLGAWAGQPPVGKKHDISHASVVNRVILSVIERYYDPTRIDAQKMFRKTLEELQKAVAELRVEYDDKAQKAVVEIGQKRVVVSMAELRSPWGLSKSLKSVFRVMQQTLSREDYDFMELEYGAANALLSTLDPHSNALPPDIYEDLRMGTTGSFGGLGIKITTDRRPPCNGKLTVVEVFDNTPAAKAGLKPGDQIIRIEGESTVNITTAEAAARLRGKPKSTVAVQVRRGDGGVKTFDIMRDSIAIESVTWKLLDGRVGYVKLEAFQGNSDAELKRALLKLREKEMRGLIFDLRGNPGGLLEVAIKIADLFIDSGTIVATAGRTEEDRSVRNASGSGTEPLYPLVVLINSSSASAAEILAGALRNHGRALLIGETTFGKGSVQMVQPMPGGGALKLTSAQYLTPGDISIQAVGVAPDITFVPSTVEKKQMDIVADRMRFSEADLDFHLDRPSSRTRDGASRLETAIYVGPAERKSDRSRFERCFIEAPDRKSYVDTYEEKFARELLSTSDAATTEELFVEARQLLEKEQGEYDTQLKASLKNLGVDWASSPAAPLDEKEPKASADVSVDARVIGKVRPGKDAKIKVSVKNTSKEPIYRLRGVAKSDNYYVEGVEFVFGMLKPGRTKSWTASVEIPSNASARIDPVTIEFERQAGPMPPKAELEIEIPPQPEPKLAYSWQFQDMGDKNGFIEPGEDVVAFVTVKNIGDGATVDAQVELSAKPGVDVVQGTFSVGKLAPGRSKSGVFKLRVSQRFSMPEAELHLSASDWIPSRFPLNRTMLDRPIKLAIASATPAPSQASGARTFDEGAEGLVYATPSADARVLARAKPGASFPVEARVKDFFRVALTEDRYAWVAAKQTAPGGKGKPLYELEMIRPPEIVVSGKWVRRVDSEKIHLEGRASHPESIKDIMIFVGDQKLLYKPCNGSCDNKNLAFEVDVPLEVGVNQILVIARHSSKVGATETIFVRRNGKAEVPKEKTAAVN